MSLDLGPGLELGLGMDLGVSLGMGVSLGLGVQMSPGVGFQADPSQSKWEEKSSRRNPGASSTCQLLEFNAGFDNIRKDTSAALASGIKKNKHVPGSGSGLKSEPLACACIWAPA